MRTDLRLKIMNSDTYNVIRPYLIKRTFEKYSEINDFNPRRMVTKFLLSDHNLEIELVGKTFQEYRHKIDYVKMQLV